MAVEFTTEEKKDLAELFIAHLSSTQSEQLRHELSKKKDIGYNKDGVLLMIELIFHNSETIFNISELTSRQQTLTRVCSDENLRVGKS